MPTYEITVTRSYVIEAADENDARAQLELRIEPDSEDTEVHWLPSRYDFGLRPRKEISHDTR